MSQFISKLQYKNYEKGEFIDEQPRDLQQTLELIRNYPWDSQRGADIQPTCPSVTIENEQGEYLKLGNYFGGKFALYFYSREHHLYELHEPTLDEACQVVEQFFNGTIDKSIFDRHYFALGSRAHFETRRFIYRFRYTYFYFMFCYCGFIILSIIIGKGSRADNLPNVTVGIIIFLLVFIGLIVAFFIRQYVKHHGTYLEISAGHDNFYYGRTPAEVKEYNKNDIDKVIIVMSGRGHTGSYEIRFKNGSVIYLSAMVIDSYTLIRKFRDGMVDYRTKSWLFKDA